VCVDDDKRGDALLGAGFGNIGDDGGQRGGADADGAVAGMDSLLNPPQ
jgi:hypothetical protein